MKTLRAQPGVVADRLRGLPLFGALPAADLERLAGAALLRRAERGEWLFRQGEPARELLCLVQGSVRVVRELPEGKEKVLHLHQAPALLAEAAVLGGVPYPAGAECSEDCLLVALPRERLLELAVGDPEFPWRLLGHLFARLRELTGMLATHAQKSATARLASYLLGLTHAGPPAVDLPAAKKDIASYLGLRPESLSRALATLQQQGAITVDEQQVRIVDRRALESAALEE